MYSIVSITLGRPLTFHIDDIDALLPSPLGEESLQLDPCSNSLAQGRPGVTMSPFLQLINYRRILAKIHQSLYTSVKARSLPLGEKVTIRRQLNSEIQAWRSKISLLGLPSVDRPASIVSSFTHPSWYEALYNNAILLLFRPSVMFPPQESLDVQDGEDVLYIIWCSSRSLIARYTDVLRGRRLNYSWITLYTIFMAGLANLYSVGRSAQRRKQGIAGFLPSLLEVLTVFRDCSNILTAICERWDDVRSSCEIFNRLSISAVQELAAVLLRDAQLSGNSQLTDSQGSRATRNNILLADHDNRPTNSIVDSPNRATFNGMNGQDLQNMTLYNTSESSEYNSPMDFQQVFQDVQNTVYQNDFSMANEVMLGFGQEWFEH